jgi:hypothetical protein
LLSCVVSELPPAGDGDGVGTDGADTAAGHTQMFGRQDDGDSAAFQALVKERGDLLSEFLLDLEAGGEGLDGPRQL